jgi:RecA-family ATPase
VTDILSDEQKCKRDHEYFLKLDAAPWQEIFEIDDADLSEWNRLTGEQRDALSPDEFDAMDARDRERLQRKYCGRDPDELAEERDFDPSGEPAWFQELWAIDLSTLTKGELEWRRENKWLRGSAANPIEIPDDVEIDGRGSPSELARKLWHRRVYTMTRQEFEDEYESANNPRNIARWLIRDEQERREPALLVRGAEDSELRALKVEINERIALIGDMSPGALAELIARLTVERDNAEDARREKLAAWRRRNEEIEQAAHVQAESQESGTPFMITNADKAKLAALGWTPDDIFYMTPSDAHRLIRKGAVKSESKPQAEGQREAPRQDGNPSHDGISAHNRQQAEQAERAKAAATLNSFRASDLAGKLVPKRKWLVPGLIPDRNVTLLGGDGGTGKSLLSLQLAVATAATGKWLNMRIETDPVIVYSAEDDTAEMHRRLVDICAAERIALDALDDLHIVPRAGMDAMLSSFDARTGEMKLPPLWNNLVRKVDQVRPKLVTIDTAADVFGGDEIKRQQVRAFVGLLRGLALDYDLAVVLLSHPSIAGMTSGTGTSGSTAWSNTVRSRLYFERVLHGGRGGEPISEADPDVRRLSAKKSNYGRTGSTIMLRYVGGVFVREDNEAGAPSSASDNKLADDTFLELLSLFESQGRNVSPNGSKSYAPKVFSEHPNSKGVRSKAFAISMERLLRDKKIWVEPVGPPSKRASRLTSVKPV